MAWAPLRAAVPADPAIRLTSQHFAIGGWSLWEGCRVVYLIECLECPLDVALAGLAGCAPRLVPGVRWMSRLVG